MFRTLARRVLWASILLCFAVQLSGETWYVRRDGGTRYSVRSHSGQCDGRADAAYPGRGINRHCAFNDLRFLWDDQTYGNRAWVISGGDTVVIEGCSSNRNQLHPSVPACRIGWDADIGPGAGRTWCFGGAGNTACYNPPIPSGTASRPTRILGVCAVRGTCNSGSITNRGKLTQIFGGLGVDTTLNLTNTKWVDIEGLEITSHNGKCIKHGSPASPRSCIEFPSPNSDDYADNGIQTNNTSSNIVLQDVYIHGFTTSGLQGPIGGPISLTRVFVGFNGFAGWNFDDGRSTPDAPGSSIIAKYVTMLGNGCNEEYPITHPQFPAMSCYDSDSGGFGDSWSGQDTKLDSFTCDHCVMAYNTKDGFIGPHTAIQRLMITNSMSYGNMGQQWKWGTGPNSTTVFENNLTVGNCRRLSGPMQGASNNYNQHLSLFCRASGDVFSFYSAAHSQVLFADNTTIGYSATMFDFSCQSRGSCASARYTFVNNIVLGFRSPRKASGSSRTPALFYFNDPSISVEPAHSLFYNLRSKSCPWFGRPDLICSDPLFVGEPPLILNSEAQLDQFNFRPSKHSPASGQGESVSGITTDFHGNSRPTPPSIGAIEP